MWYIYVGLVYYLGSLCLYAAGIVHAMRGDKKWLDRISEDTYGGDPKYEYTIKEAIFVVLVRILTCILLWPLDIAFELLLAYTAYKTKHKENIEQ